MKKFIFLVFCLFFIQLNAVSAIPVENFKCSLDETEDIEDFKDLTEQLIYNNQFSDVIKIYSDCIKEYPENETLYNNRANIYKRIKMYDKALTDYNKALEILPDYIIAMNGKLSLLILQLKLDEALKLSEQIIKLKPRYAQTYYYRATIFELKNDYDNALKNYNMVIQFNPNQNPMAYYNRANLYYQKGNYSLAIQDYKECLFYIDSAPKNNIEISKLPKGNIYYNLALSYFKIDDEKSTRLNLEKALKFYELENNIQGVIETKKLLES